MAKGIPVTSRRGIQLVALLLGAWLVVSAYLYATTGAGWLLTPMCAEQPAGPSPASYVAAAWRGLVGVGFVAVAVKDLRGPRLRDPLLLGLVLIFASLSLLSAGANGLATGLLHFGTNRCIEIGPPWSYGYAALILLAGTVALLGAVTAVVHGGDD